MGRAAWCQTLRRKCHNRMPFGIILVCYYNAETPVAVLPRVFLVVIACSSSEIGKTGTSTSLKYTVITDNDMQTV